METAVCNLCGADRCRRLYRNFGMDISKCRACGLVYAGPERLTREETWKRYNPRYFAEEYLPSFGVVDGPVDLDAFDARYARTLGFLRPARHLGTLLEIGCGAGFFLKAAERDGWRVTGLEVMSAGVEFARQRLELEVQPVAVEDAQLAGGAFDVVVMFEVIEHLSDPSAVVHRAKALLRPGGCLALSTPNVSSLSRFALGRDWAVLNPGEHLYYFGERTLRPLLERAGFVSVWFDRHYAGAGRYETLMPTHTFAPGSWRARRYRKFIDGLEPWALGKIQSLGLADSLHCLAWRPAQK